MEERKCFWLSSLSMSLSQNFAHLPQDSIQ